jgi:hypothetical protein
MDETTRIRTKSKLLGALLAFGLIPVSAVVEWADQQIETVERPDDTLVEVALASKRPAHEVESLLESIKGTVDRESYLRSLFSFSCRHLEHDPGQLPRIASMLYRMAIADAFAGLPAEHFLSAVSDDVNGFWAETGSVRLGLITALNALSMDPYAESDPLWWAPRARGIPVGCRAWE